MVKKIDKEIRRSVEKYLAEVSKYYKLDAVYLFGSFAKGTQKENSDIDIAIVSRDIKNRYLDMGSLYALKWDFDLRIEPHPFHINEFNKNDTMMYNEIIRTGIPIKFAN